MKNWISFCMRLYVYLIVLVNFNLLVSMGAEDVKQPWEKEGFFNNHSINLESLIPAGHHTVYALVAKKIKDNKDVKELNLSKNILEEDDIEFITPILQNSGIHTLILKNCKIDDRGALIFFNELQNNKGLRHLDLSHNRITGVGIVNIAEVLGHNTVLTELDLSHNPIGSDVGAQLKDFLNLNKCLKVLNLSTTKLDGVYSVSLIVEGILKNSSLKHINLSHNPLGDLGAVSIKRLLLHNKFLEKLNLSDCGIGDFGFVKLMQGLKENETIEDIDLSDNPFVKNKQPDFPFQVVEKISSLYITVNQEYKFIIKRKKETSTSSKSVSLSEEITSNDFSLTNEELRNTPSGSFVSPSESTTTQFLKNEGLDLLVKGGRESFGEATPRIGLSIDGGGIRGVMPALWLKKLKNDFEEEGIQAPLYDIFDYVGGTSIGGIISLGVAADLTPNSIVDIFAQNRGQIFVEEGKSVVIFDLPGHAYSANTFEAFLQKIFGTEKRLSDLKTNLLVTACTDDGHPYLFKREDADVQEEGNNKNYRLWEVARSASVAPHYFKSFQPIDLQAYRPKFVDGGIWVNNPSMLITASIVKEFHDGKLDPNNIHLLSLGTGDYNSQAIPQSAGKLSAKESISALMNSHNRGTHMVMNQLLGSNYHRVNVAMDKEIDLTDISDKAYEKMQEYANSEGPTNNIKNFVEQTKEIVRKKLERD